MPNKQYNLQHLHLFYKTCICNGFELKKNWKEMINVYVHHGDNQSFTFSDDDYNNIIM